MNRVLVVEDKTELLSDFCDVIGLEIENAEIFPFNGDRARAEDAIGFLKDTGPEDRIVLVLDHNLMNEFKGNEFLSLLLEQIPDIRKKLFVIGISDMDETQKKYLNEFGVAFIMLPKVFDTFVLANLVAEGLNREISEEITQEQQVA